MATDLTETIPLNACDAESIPLQIVTQSESIVNHQNIADSNTKYYNQDLIIKLNNIHQNKLIDGYLRQYYTDKINPYSIPISLIFDYYNSIYDNIYPGKYLFKSQYFHNSIHIDSNSFGLIHQAMWPKNLVLTHDTLRRHKLRPMISYLLFTFILLFIAIILFFLDREGIAIAALLGLLLVCPCTIVSIWIFYKTVSRKYKLIHFNVNSKLIQEWSYIFKEIRQKNKKYYLCQIVDVMDISGFDELERIYFERPYIVTHRDINGNQTRYFHDGTLRFVTNTGSCKILQVSYHSEWIELYSRIKDIMDCIDEYWFQQVEWEGFV